MTFELDDDHLQFQAVCRDFVTREVMPLVDKAEESGEFPHSLWEPMAQAGLLGLGYPEEIGGTGGDMLAMAILAEELAKASGGIAVTPLVSSYMAAPHLHEYGSPQLQEEWLRPALNGEKILAIGVTEPEAGSDVAGMKTRAVQTDGGWKISGTKLFITNGGFADAVIVAARTDPAERHAGITMFVVEKGSPGFTVGRPLKKMGWHSSDTRELIFEDCFVPDERIVGSLNRGFYQIANAFQGERVSLSGMGVGLAQAAFDDALAYAKERKAFGNAIGKYQSIRHVLSAMATKIEQARLITYQAAARLDQGHPEAFTSVAMAKLASARIANEVADDAVQIFGGYGFIEETRVALHYRDARILRIGGGTDEIQMEVLAKRFGL